MPEKGERAHEMFLQSKLTKKLLLVFVLTGTLVYLRQPQRQTGGAYPGYTLCRALCNGNASCIAGCETTWINECAKQCSNYAGCCPNGMRWIARYLRWLALCRPHIPSLTPLRGSYIGGGSFGGQVANVAFQREHILAMAEQKGQEAKSEHRVIQRGSEVLPDDSVSTRIV